MKVLTTTLLIFALMGASMAAELPTAPSVQKTSVPVKQVELDPYAWALTAAFPVGIIGTFTKPSIGLAAGVAVAVFGNGLQNSHNAHVDMLGGLAGAGGTYLLVKTLKRDWHKKR